MKHYSKDELYYYIEGKIFTEKENKEIKKHLNECFDCFRNYIDLKETKYLMENGEEMPNKIYEKLLKTFEQKKTSRFSAIISFTKNVFNVFSNDIFNIKVLPFLNTSFATRNEKEDSDKHNVVILQKKIDEYSISINISRLPDNKHFNLEVNVSLDDNRVEHLLIFLKEAGKEIEFIDAGKKTLFEYELSENDYELSFEKSKMALFSINLTLKRE